MPAPSASSVSGVLSPVLDDLPKVGYSPCALESGSLCNGRWDGLFRMGTPMIDDAGAEARVVGRYALHGEIASGGMATVHYGRLIGQAGFSRTVAIKRMHPHYVKDPDFVSMLLDEARLVARIRHPNVVPVLDVVALDGELFLVMEYVLGETLSKLLRTSRKTEPKATPAMAASIMACVMEGLHAAHEAVNEDGHPLGIVHRDVSPQNILVGADGVPRVLDFGIAKATGRLQTTRDGQLKGKVPYMSPEQIMGAELDRRSDIFAAGAVLWEALAGQRLFRAENDVALYRKVLEEPIQPPSQFVKDVPPKLVSATMTALEREPSRRFQTAQQMAEALEEAVRLVTPREIGRWVDAVAADVIHRRTRQVKEVESGSSSIRRADFSKTDPKEPFSDSVISVLSAAEKSAPVIASVTSSTVAPNVPPPPRKLPPPRPPAPKLSPAPPPSPVASATPFSPPEAVAPLGAPPSEGAEDDRELVLPAGRRRIGLTAILGVVTLAAVVLIVAAVVGLGSRESATTATLSSVAVPTSAAATQQGTATLAVETAATAATAATPETPEPPNVDPAPPSASVSAAPPATTAAKVKPPTPTTKPVRTGCNPPYTIDADGIRIPKPECF